MARGFRWRSRRWCTSWLRGSRRRRRRRHQSRLLRPKVLINGMRLVRGLAELLKLSRRDKGPISGVPLWRCALGYVEGGLVRLLGLWLAVLGEPVRLSRGRHVCSWMRGTRAPVCPLQRPRPRPTTGARSSLSFLLWSVPPGPRVLAHDISISIRCHTATSCATFCSLLVYVSSFVFFSLKHNISGVLLKYMSASPPRPARAAHLFLLMAVGDRRFVSWPE